MTMDPELETLRQAIDSVDNQILDLLAKRLGLVLQVARVKRDRKMPVYDPERERLVLARLAERAPQILDEAVVHRIFERIIDESRRIEQHHMTPIIK